ncbi:MAG: phage holin family protein [Chloroflexi bacterium]|nr:phage holin family protein [Chloroflexota bacterium]
MGFLFRLLINAAGLIAAAAFVNWLHEREMIQGEIVVRGLPAAVVAALIFGLVNALIRPFVMVVTCLLNILTLGLFTLVVNALMLLLTSWIVELLNRAILAEIAFSVHGFLAAFIGALVVSIVSALLTRVVR